jgi:integrase
MDEITRNVLLGYKKWQLENLRRKKYGKRENTIVNNYRYLNAFLRLNGIKMVKDKYGDKTDRGVMNYLDMPKASEKTVDSYSPEEIRLLMDAATLDEADMIQFFLKTGCRDAEVMHAQWSDIRKKTDGSGYEFHVQEKLIHGWNWKPKNKSDRWIDLSTKLHDRLMERKTRVGTSKYNLIFPNEAGNPDTHLIKRLKNVWQRVQQSAEKEGHTGLAGRPELHKFRRTFITGMLANQVPPQDVMNYSGHTDYKSFSRYMSVNTALGKKGIERMSEAYGD